MTATPIPRSVTMTLFGDLDVSTLRDSPPGRQKVNTYLANEDAAGQVVGLLPQEAPRRPAGLRRRAAGRGVGRGRGRQPGGDLRDAGQRRAGGFRLGLIHGRMTPAEKDAVMDDFRSGEIQVLVCTSVVEVGVDVPNATLMTIESGHRFGLAQLHQLRGRISRGKFPGFCCVFGDPQTEESRERLKAFVASTDGFELAETDFKLRGPGDIFGTKQHGLPPLRIADLLRDQATSGRSPPRRPGARGRRPRPCLRRSTPSCGG